MPTSPPVSPKRQLAVVIAIAMGAIGLIILGNQPNLFAGWWRVLIEPDPEPTATDLPARFLVVAGGGAPSYNEIALEKNVLYFQRTLDTLGLDQERASLWFANGNDGRATIRYLDRQGQEKFKVPDIPRLQGAATYSHVRQWLQGYPTTLSGLRGQPLFFYFTGHGSLNAENPQNNALILWGERSIAVEELATWLDQWPQTTPFVAMMAQCYGGAFANLIYEGGNPQNPVAPQSRCGFFATVNDRPSVGCTPLVNEADYRDYSSSFFAGLSGRDRVGNRIEPADYNLDGRVSYAEAHAFTKVDSHTPDWPISTLEAWLQEQATEAQVQEILSAPITTWERQARPAQRYVIRSLSQRLGYDRAQPFAPQAQAQAPENEVHGAFIMRLQMELITVAMEHRVRDGEDGEAIATLEQLLACEAGSWSGIDR